MANELEYVFEAPLFSVRVSGHRFSVFSEGTELVCLDVRTAVPQTLDSDDGCREDEEPEIPVLVRAEVTNTGAAFAWSGRSALWEKEYELKVDHLRFYYTVRVRGIGRVDAVRYFSADGKGSAYEFSEGFYPCQPMQLSEDYTFKAGVSTHRTSGFHIPPMFCYSFRTERIGTRLGLGLVAERGEHNFNDFDYVCRHYDFESGFWLQTDQSGHTSVDGEWTAPAIVGFVGDTDEEVMRRYSEYYYLTGIAQMPDRSVHPRFWYGPMACGWLEQGACGYLKDDEYYAGQCCETLYDAFAAKLLSYGMHPTLLVVDDKWAADHTVGLADPNKFPDMRAYVERRRREGIRTMLWYKLWDAQNWPEELCIQGDTGPRLVDPSTPEYRQHVRDRIRLYLSDEPGCYNVDGFKLDFAFLIPHGRKLRTYSGKYGVELLYDMMKDIYDAAKAVKPEAIVNCSACHPYFAHLTDQARLHDYEPRSRNCREDLSMRARMYQIAMPGVLMDTDNSGFCSLRDTVHWQMNQGMVGIPDLYCITKTPSMEFREKDLLGISQMWAEYSALADRMAGKDEIR